MTRRTLVASLATAAMAKGTSLNAQAPANQNPPHPHHHEAPKEWTPRLGVLGPYSPANVEFAQSQGFTNMILSCGKRATIDPDTMTDAKVDEVKSVLKKYNMHVSAFQVDGNHTHPDPAKRKSENEYFVKVIELAGKMNVPYLGTQSGKNPDVSFQEQVQQIVQVYTDKYFPACERNHVRILWEPYPNEANIATSPVGFEALFTAFGNSPYVGLQFDPSHGLRQFMDPIATAREFVDHIYDVHLKDTEIIWPVLRAGGIDPVNDAHWWRYRIPGMGQIVWRDFFTVLQDVGYSGAMSIEQEDPLYGADNNPGPDFSSEFKMGFIMAKKYLNQYVPEVPRPNNYQS
jgi:sugar phosphate isomerase/epimerase